MLPRVLRWFWSSIHTLSSRSVFSIARRRLCVSLVAACGVAAWKLAQILSLSQMVATVEVESPSAFPILLSISPASKHCSTSSSTCRLMALRPAWHLGAGRHSAASSGTALGPHHSLQTPQKNVSVPALCVLISGPPQPRPAFCSPSSVLYVSLDQRWQCKTYESRQGEMAVSTLQKQNGIRQSS